MDNSRIGSQTPVDAYKPIHSSVDPESGQFNRRKVQKGARIPGFIKRGWSESTLVNKVKKKLQHRSAKVVPPQIKLQVAPEKPLRQLPVQEQLGRIHKQDQQVQKALEQSSLGADQITAQREELTQMGQKLVLLRQGLQQSLSDQAHLSAKPSPESMQLAEADKRLAQLQNMVESRRAELERRLEEHPRSTRYLVKSQISHYKAALSTLNEAMAKTDHPKKTAKLQQLDSKLSAQLASLEEKLRQPSREVADDAAIKQLKKLPAQLTQTLKKSGVKTSLTHHKHVMAEKANNSGWEVSKKPVSFHYGGQYRNLSQTVTPASKMQLTSEHLPDFFQKGGESNGIFKDEYSTPGISSHCGSEVKHAVNLNSSVLKDEDGKVVFQAVRHAVNSPYDLKPGSENRKAGALARAREEAVAALQLHPEKMEQALRGETVDLLLTSNSLLTPDPFRHAISKNEKDELAMLQDQVEAWQALGKESYLPVRLPHGEVVEVPVNIKVIPLNFGLNRFSTGSAADIVGGWGASDSLNKEGLQQLLGSLSEGEDIGGVVADFLAKHPDHPDKKYITQLAAQIKDIFIHKKHHQSQGGAAKLASRVMVLTHMIDGTPLVNCKSAKDRTALAVVAAEWLMTRIRMNEKVPDFDEISPADKRLFKELAVQGNHFQIQEDNSGAPGFKADSAVLREYVESEEDMQYIKGLSDAVLP